MANKTWSDEWKRTNPDLVVYLPELESGFDSVNQHFLVTKTPGSAWLAIWTQGADEGEVNQSVVSSRSTDRGKTWGEPIVVDGPAKAIDKNVRAKDQKGEWKAVDASLEEDERHAGIAQWGFPIVVPALERIYCFYTRNEGLAEFRYDVCGILCGKWSDDDGITWSEETVDLPIRRTILDHPDERFPIWWIIWQTPYVTSRGEVIAPFSRGGAKASPFPGALDSCFLRFDNILTETDPRDLTTTTLPDGERGLRIPNFFEGNTRSFALEPSIVELSDGRFYCVMTTTAGHLSFSISVDRGHTWSVPAPLYRDNESELMLNPQVPAPLYQLKDGRCILVYYNNRGDIHGGHFPCGGACFRSNRYPAYISVGHEDPTNPFVPIRFSPPKFFATSDGHSIGVGGRTEVATYPSLLEDGDDRILFYPDRKHFLLGKHITDEWLNDCEQGK